MWAYKDKSQGVLLDTLEKIIKWWLVGSYPVMKSATIFSDINHSLPLNKITDIRRY